MGLKTKYVLFAVFSTLMNLIVQEVVISIFDSFQYALMISMLAGTAVGLMIKYYLDKIYIFHYITKSIKHDAKSFFLYVAMGGVTTVIFFTFELMFNYFFGGMFKYLGAVIGLSIGYAAKYKLDSVYVFRE